MVLLSIVTNMELSVKTNTLSTNCWQQRNRIRLSGILKVNQHLIRINRKKTHTHNNFWLNVMSQTHCSWNWFLFFGRDRWNHPQIEFKFEYSSLLSVENLLVNTFFSFGLLKWFHAYYRSCKCLFTAKRMPPCIRFQLFTLQSRIVFIKFETDEREKLYARHTLLYGNIDNTI